jgi:signal transduction histidine kinase
LTIAVILPLVVSLGAFMLLQYQTQRKDMLDSLALVASQTGLTIQNSLKIAMLNHNQEELQHILDSIGKNQTLRIVYLLDASGKVVFAPEGKGVGTQLNNQDISCQPCHQLPPSQRPGSIVISLPSGQSVFRTMNPIVNAPECQSCHNPAQRLTGVLLTDISMAPLEASLRNALWQHLLVWMAAILVSVLVVNFVINRFVFHRLAGITTAIKEVDIGRLSPILPVSQTDEIGQLTLAFNEMVRQLEVRDVENRQLSTNLYRQNIERRDLLRRLITAQEDERRRVSRDLHDELGQALAGLALQTEATRNLVMSNPEQAIRVLQQTQNLIYKTSDQMYKLILALRPSVLDDLGLVAAVRVYAERIFSEEGIAFKIDASCYNTRLSPELETVLYRVFQESLHNIVRHACAQQVLITLSIENGFFRGEIMDDGQGFDPESIRSNPDEPHGLGLLGMRERVTEYHGTVEIFSSVDHGTKVVVLIPLEEVPVG